MKATSGELRRNIQPTFECIQLRTITPARFVSGEIAGLCISRLAHRKPARDGTPEMASHVSGKRHDLLPF